MGGALTAILLACPSVAAHRVFDSAVLVFAGGDEVMMVETADLSDVVRGQRSDGLNEVTFVMSEADAERFHALTTRIEGERLSITFCGTLLADPTVLMPIAGGNVLITGGTDAATEALFSALEARTPCPDTGGS